MGQSLVEPSSTIRAQRRVEVSTDYMCMGGRVGDDVGGSKAGCMAILLWNAVGKVQIDDGNNTAITQGKGETKVVVVGIALD